MKFLKFLLAFIAFAISLTSNQLSAQNFQLAGLGYSNYAKTEIKDSPTKQEIAFQEFSVFAKLPIKFKNQKTIVMNTLRYGFVQPTTYNSPLFLAVKTQKNLHSISFSSMFVQKFGQKWTFIVGLTPTLASDFKQKLNSDDFLIQGLLLASKKTKDKWTLGGGLVYTTQLGDPKFLPAIQLRYLNGRHFFNVLLPSFVNYLYKFEKQEKLRLGIRLATNGGNFNVNNQDFTQVIPNSIHKIIYSRVNMGAIFNYQLTKTILIEGFGGISAARKFKLKDASNIFRKYDAANGGFFSLGILLTPPTKSTEGSIDN
jgi:hypothetical protein